MPSKVFIGSSVENIQWAKFFQLELHHSTHIEDWSQGIFRPSDFPIEALTRKLDEADFGLFVCAGDDIVKKRGVRKPAVRDNVLLELGMYLGRLGRTRTFLALPNDAPDLPSDLLGITPVKFDATKSTQASVGPASTQISEVIRFLGPKDESVVPSTALDQLAACMTSLNTLVDNDLFLNQSPQQKLNMAIGKTHEHAQTIVDRVWPDMEVVVSVKLPHPTEHDALSCHYSTSRIPARRLTLSTSIATPETIPINGSIAGYAYREQLTEPLVVGSIDDLPKGIKVGKDSRSDIFKNVGSVVVCPIRLHGEVVGVVKLDQEHRGFFSADDPVVLSVIRSIVSGFQTALTVAFSGHAIDARNARKLKKKTSRKTKATRKSSNNRRK